MARRTKLEAEQTREQILEAAEQVFLANGVAQTSLDQVAEGAGVTRGAIYWHFADKKALFRALLERVRLPQEELLAQVAIAGHHDPIGFLEQISLECVTLIANDPRLKRVHAILLLRCEYVGEMEGALERQKIADEALRQNFVRILQIARDNGSLNPVWTPKIAGFAYASMIYGVWSDWLRYGQSFKLTEIWPQCVSEMCASFRADVRTISKPPKNDQTKPRRKSLDR